MCGEGKAYRHDKKELEKQDQRTNLLIKVILNLYFSNYPLLTCSGPKPVLAWLGADSIIFTKTKDLLLAGNWTSSSTTISYTG